MPSGPTVSRDRYPQFRVDMDKLVLANGYPKDTLDCMDQCRLGYLYPGVAVGRNSSRSVATANSDELRPLMCQS